VDLRVPQQKCMPILDEGVQQHIINSGACACAEPMWRNHAVRCREHDSNEAYVGANVNQGSDAIFCVYLGCNVQSRVTLWP
jgi:hypothetical protein